MSAKTKIVVLRMKELILTGAFVALGVLIIVLLFLLLMPNKSGPEEPVQENPAESTPSSTDVSGSASGVLYVPGIYTTELVLGGQAVDVAVEMVRDGCWGLPVPDYVDENVSDKVVKIIQSYVGVVNKMVWRKEN